jgi:fucose permease
MPRNRYMVVIVLLTFFVISLVTNILGPIVPDIISSFHVSHRRGISGLRFLYCLRGDVDSCRFPGGTIY